VWLSNHNVESDPFGVPSRDVGRKPTAKVCGKVMF